MKRPLFSFIAGLGLAIASASMLHAGEVSFSVSSTQPDGSFAINSHGDSGSNNVCKWHPQNEPGSRRELGQRIVTGRTQQTINRYVLKVPEIQSGVGHHAPGSEFFFRVVRFAANNEVAPISEPVLYVTGSLPSELATGDYLIIDFSDIDLEPSSVYGLEVGFTEAGDGRSVNFETTGAASNPGGRIYFHTNDPKADQMKYVLRSANFVFLLGTK